MTEIRVYQDQQALNRAAAQWIVQAAAEGVAAQGSFNIALSGGSTPRGVYEFLATPEYQARISWMKMYVFWGDERCVPPDHLESNYRMAQLALLDHIPVPAEHIYRLQGEVTPQLAADAYEQILHRQFKGSRDYTFDLVLLGLGEDGHTASLFPGSPALEEKEHWVVPAYAEHLESWRLSLTPVCINAAARIMFIVTGESKAPILSKVISRTGDYPHYPAQWIKPDHGQLTWFVDKLAAANI